MCYASKFARKWKSVQTDYPDTAGAQGLTFSGTIDLPRPHGGAFFVIGPVQE
jgi:hypothetical protein